MKKGWLQSPKPAEAAAFGDNSPRRALAYGLFYLIKLGEVAERSKAAVLKTVDG